MKTFEEILDCRNKSNNFSRFLGIRTTEIKTGYARGEIIVTDEMNNPIDSVHGGCIFTLADIVSGSAVASHGRKAVTASGNIHYLSPAIGTKKLFAVANEVKYGKNLSVVDVDITDDKDKLIAKVTFSFFFLSS